MPGGWRKALHLLVNDVFPREPIRQWVLSFPFQLRFLFASYPELMGRVLGIVYRTLATHIIHKAGFTQSTAAGIGRAGEPESVNGWRRFRSAGDFWSGMRRTRTSSWTSPKTRRCRNSTDIRSPIVSPWVPTRERKVFTLQSLPPAEKSNAASSRVANVAGFSLHAGLMVEAQQRDKLERLCRYIARPAVSEKRLSRLDDGRIRYELKTPYRDGTTQPSATRAARRRTRACGHNARTTRGMLR